VGDPGGGAGGGGSVRWGSFYKWGGGLR